jgi:hypothetical protein
MPALLVLARGGTRIAMTMRGLGPVAVIIARVRMCTWAIMVTLYAEQYENVSSPGITIVSGRMSTYTGAGLGDGMKPGDLCIHQRWPGVNVAKRSIRGRAWHSRAGMRTTMTVTVAVAMFAVTAGVRMRARAMSVGARHEGQVDWHIILY